MGRRIAALATWVALSASVVATVVGSASGSAAAAPAQRATKAPACAKTYDVVSGDYWIKIASKAGVTTTALYQANGATATTPLYPGMRICLPDTATVPATTPPPTAPATTVPPATAPAAPGSVQLAAFPAQGPCSFTDTFQAPRGGGRVHEGVDLIAKTGQYVYAVANGRLSKQAVDKPGSLSGNAWWLTGDDGSYFFYAHMSAFAPGLKIGSKVQAGQIIGFIGSTGNAGVSHLHFEVHPKGGVAVNPTPIIQAIDGCKTSAVPPQPNGEAPAPPTNTAPAVTAPPSTSPPATTAPPAAPVVLPPAAPVSTQPGSLWQFITPVTAFDSAASGALGAGATRTMGVNQACGVPAG
ncbi:MAG: peptidoglycan DD-metalloendopeptidase family protein, partial [Actinobacteria bacterium]|nr:peptidoglycan DD-metalloendopeptidase family protein [Actinomycetota bacterium]